MLVVDREMHSSSRQQTATIASGVGVSGDATERSLPLPMPSGPPRRNLSISRACVAHFLLGATEVLMPARGARSGENDGEENYTQSVPYIHAWCHSCLDSVLRFRFLACLMLVLATPRLLGRRPPRPPVGKTRFAVIGRRCGCLGDHAGSALVRAAPGLLVVGPAGTPIVEASLAVEGLRRYWGWRHRHRRERRHGWRRRPRRRRWRRGGRRRRRRRRSRGGRRRRRCGGRKRRWLWWQSGAGLACGEATPHLFFDSPALRVPSEAVDDRRRRRCLWRWGLRGGGVPDWRWRRQRGRRRWRGRGGGRAAPLGVRAAPGQLGIAPLVLVILLAVVLGRRSQT
mmetsp:Transcript_44313/g.115239  ORF Transcript_44313/g.115239 Transcript_44313/m.115239 type:complete len:341 (-) Transcript_44313:145-1167(-)